MSVLNESLPRALELRSVSRRDLLQFCKLMVATLARRGASGAPQGLRLSWIVWRGPDNAKFDQASILVKDQKATGRLLLDDGVSVPYFFKFGVWRRVETL